MNLTQNELSALTIVHNEGDEQFNAQSYLKITSRLKACLNASFVSFSVHRFVVYIEYCEKGTSEHIKIQSKRSLLESAK